MNACVPGAFCCFSVSFCEEEEEVIVEVPAAHCTIIKECVCLEKQQPKPPSETRMTSSVLKRDQNSPKRGMYFCLDLRNSILLNLLCVWMCLKFLAVRSATRLPKKKNVF